MHSVLWFSTQLLSLGDTTTLTLVAVVSLSLLSGGTLTKHTRVDVWFVSPSCCDEQCFCARARANHSVLSDCQVHSVGYGFANILILACKSEFYPWLPIVSVFS